MSRLRRPLPRGRRLLLFGGPVALLVVLGFLWFWPSSPLPASPDPEAAEGPRRVRVAKVEEHAGLQAFHASGVVRASRQAELAFTMSGRVVERPFDLGDVVEEGAVLARLDAGPLEHRVRAARAETRRLRTQLEQAERDERRARALAASGALAESDADQASAASTSLSQGAAGAAALAADAARQVEETMLRAPFAGRIVDVRVELGEVAPAGVPVFVLTGDGGLEVEVEIPETRVAQVRPGAVVSFEFPLARLGPRAGTVIRVGGAGRGGWGFPVVAEVAEDEGVLPGMAVDVRFTTAGESSLAVPVPAVVDPGGQHPSVYRVVADRVQRVPVEVLGLVGTQTAIRSDVVHVGDDVVVGGHAALVDGEAVEPVPTQDAPRPLELRVDSR